MKHTCSCHIQIWCPLVEISTLRLCLYVDMSTSGHHIRILHSQECVICITCVSVCTCVCAPACAIECQLVSANCYDCCSIQQCFFFVLLTRSKWCWQVTGTCEPVTNTLVSSHLQIWNLVVSHLLSQLAFLQHLGIYLDHRWSNSDWVECLQLLHLMWLHLCQVCLSHLMKTLLKHQPTHGPAIE